MAKNDLTAEYLREILHYDPETGAFTWLVSKGTRARPGRTTGTVHPTTGYLVVTIDGAFHQLHRLAWLYMNGKYPDCLIDHINGIRTDNSIRNLRDATYNINAQNIRTGRGKKSSLLGVHWVEKGGWFSRIKANGGVFHLGFHKSEQLAHEAYIRAKRLIHEGCTI